MVKIKLDWKKITIFGILALYIAQNIMGCVPSHNTTTTDVTASPPMPSFVPLTEATIQSTSTVVRTPQPSVQTITSPRSQIPVLVSPIDGRTPPPEHTLGPKGNQAIDISPAAPSSTPDATLAGFETKKPVLYYSCFDGNAQKDIEQKFLDTHPEYSDMDEVMTSMVDGDPKLKARLENQPSYQRYIFVSDEKSGKLERVNLFVKGIPIGFFNAEISITDGGGTARCAVLAVPNKIDNKITARFVPFVIQVQSPKGVYIAYMSNPDGKQEKSLPILERTIYGRESVFMLITFANPDVIQFLESVQNFAPIIPFKSFLKSISEGDTMKSKFGSYTPDFWDYISYMQLQGPQKYGMILSNIIHPDKAKRLD